MKLALDVTASQLADLITSCPKFAELFDSQQSDAFAGSTTTESRNFAEHTDASEEDLESTRQLGSSLFEKGANAHGLLARAATNAEPGDYMVTNGSKSRPVVVVCAKSPRFSVRKQWAKIPEVVVVYVWLNHKRVFLMTYGDTLKILGPKPIASPSFKDNGYYTMTCNGRRESLMSAHENNWAIFK
jgi:hypothetical protein